MPTLPAHPNLDQLRHQAKDLLRRADTGDNDAHARIKAVSDRLTLAGAQLAVARSYGLASWPKLKSEVEARTLDLAEKVDAFCTASIRDGSGRAARLLAATPEIAGYNFFAAVVLGDAARVSTELRRDPGLASRRDPRSGWAPLHAVCASRWCQFEPARAGGLLAVARLLLEAGADPTARTIGWSPLRCVIASANSGPSNRALAELLLERGAIPDDHDLYLAGFAHDRHQLLPLLLQRVPEVSQIAEQALAAPISNGDTESVRLLLDRGAQIEARDASWNSTPLQWAAVGSGEKPGNAAAADWVETVRILLEAGASVDGITLSADEPKEPSAEVAELLRAHV